MNRRRIAKGILTAASLAWIGGAGWMTFAHLLESDVPTYQSAQVKEQMQDCDGSFKQRYECKEAIVIQTHRDTFYTLAGRLALIGLPPLVAWIIFPFVFPKRLTIRRRKTEDADVWKQRADQHILHPRGERDR